MQACESRVPDLVDAACGELAPARRDALERHLAGCAACRAELAGMRDTGALLLETRDEPDDLTLSGFARRTALAAEARRDRSSWRAFWTGRRLASLLGAGALAAATALVVLQPAEPAPSPANVTVERGLVAEAPAEADTETYLWDLYDETDEVFAELAGRDAALSLDDGLSGLTDAEFEELVAMLGDESQG